MTWGDDDRNEDRPWNDFGRPGGDFHGLRPSFDNPLTWAVKLFRTAGITVRVHAVFIIFIVIALLRSLLTPEQGASQPVGFGVAVVAVISLFVLVLIHEFGHCLACRWVGGEADEILMWPLGGLAMCQPPNRWGPHLWTAVGGPAVNVVVCLIAGPMLWFNTGIFLGVALPNPINPGAGLAIPAVQHSLPNMTLYLIHATSLLLLLFNLLPIFPLDGGRIVQAGLWARFGYSKSMRYAVRTGFVGAVLLLVFGAVTTQWIVVGIALFGAAICYVTLKQVEATDEFMGWSADEPGVAADDSQRESSGRPSPLEQWRQRRQEKREQQAIEDEQQIDRILHKIAEHGMNSLTRTERRQLRRATERKQKQDD